MPFESYDHLLQYYTKKVGSPVVLREEGAETITCCYCGLQHGHGDSPGHRMAHCHHHKSPMTKSILINGKKFEKEDGYTILNYKLAYSVPRK